MSKKLTEYKPKNLADPRIQTIPLEPVKQLIAEREEIDKEILESKEKEIEELKQVIFKYEVTQKNKIKVFEWFYDSLSLECIGLIPRRKITITECAARIQKGLCDGNMSCRRREILYRLGANPKNDF